MITIFASPKPFAGHIGTIQRNAIASWVRLHPQCQVILFGDEVGIAEAAKDFGLRHVAEVARNEYGTPLLNDLFEKAAKLASNDLLCYVNCDIILMSDFRIAINNLASHIDRFLMVGQCWNLDVTEPLAFEPPVWERSLRESVSQAGKRRGPWAIDYFAFTRGLYERIPPFALGRAYFDNWLVWKGRDLKAAVVDATDAVTAVHQNHDYSHVSGGMDWSYRGEEAKRNLNLGGNHVCNIFDATSRLSPGGVTLNWKGRFPFAPLRHMGWPVERSLTRWWLRALAITRPMRHPLGLRLSNFGRLKEVLMRRKRRT